MGLLTRSMSPTIATVPPRKRRHETMVLAKLNLPGLRKSRTTPGAKKNTMQSAKVAQYCAGESRVSVSKMFDAGARRSYRNEVLRLAVTGDCGCTTSTRG